MSGFSYDGPVMGDLGEQVAALREDLACLTAQARQDATRVVALENALRLVRDLMRDLPAHDNVATVAVRLRAHFDYLAAQVIDDALAAPLRDAPSPDDADIGPRGPSTDGAPCPPQGAVRVHDLTKGPA